MRLLHVPGVHHPHSDTWLLAEAMRAAEVKGRRVADLCTGSGALAIAAARAGAAEVLAVDVSRRAVLATRINARLNGCSVRPRRGDMFAALAGERFDVILSNPPYVPAATDALPRHRTTTPLDGGRDGRALVDRICREGPRHLRERGSLLLVHSSVCGVQETCERLRAQGLDACVVARVRGPLGPVLRARAPMLRARGLLGQADEEELVVIHGRARG
jgi:release factor glutamine methyltransferase